VRIRLLVLDVDGVLTDGTFWLREDGDEWKAFHATDGLGLRLLMDAGVEVALLSGRRSAVVERRARELGIGHVIQGADDKAAAIYRLGTELGVEPVEMAYMGDDLVDVPAMRLVGFAAAPADARPEALAASAWVAARGGGRGAVRDLCEHLLREMGRWDEVAARFRA
jgi:3-deoxy-D-manno-octulosonate 8-phosphate phosphatase (KDO 8-P phosphatase)